MKEAIMSKARLLQKYIKKKRVIIPSVLFCVLILFALLTDPFGRFSIIDSPYKATFDNGTLTLTEEYDIRVRNSYFFRYASWIKKGLHILSNAYIGNTKAEGTTDDEIIADIYDLRFDPSKPYLIAGDHFNMFYPRNLGIFYYPLLDPKTALSKEDWRERQQMLLQSTAYVIEVCADAGDLTTTIVPVSKQSVATVNVFSYPSDTMYSILYALDSMMTDSFRPETEFIDTGLSYELYTEEAARKLLSDRREDLQMLLQTYRERVFDEGTGLVRITEHFSGTKDIMKRTSSFYDNVVYWRTLQLAMKLELIPEDKPYLSDLKERIIEAFWYEEGGFFIEDLSLEAQEKTYYSSDWLIVLYTGFLDITVDQERKYYMRSVDYIQKNEIDEPFGLKYHPENRSDQLFFFTRIFVPSYGGSSIWSNWGMDYIKTLLMLYKETGKEEYFVEAGKQLAVYEENIVQYKGFPEIYDKDGEMLHNFFYRSMRRTGWVVNYVQAREMYEYLENRDLGIEN